VHAIGADSEIEKAFPARTTVTVARLFAQLPAAALATDLQMQASLGGKIPATRQATKSINYACPTYVEEYCPGITPICDGTPGTPGYPGSPGTPYGPGGTTAKEGSSGSAFGCTTTQSSRMGNLGPWIGLALAGLVAGAVSRRRRGGR
jgi:MYXO-CTERM domain-containing protein